MSLTLSLALLGTPNVQADALGSFSGAGAGEKPLFGTITLQGPRGNPDGPALFGLLAGPIRTGGGNQTKVGSYPNLKTPLLDFTCNVAVINPGFGSCTVRVFRSKETVLDPTAQTIHFETKDTEELEGISALFSIQPRQDFKLVSSDLRFVISRKGSIFTISYAWKK